VATIYGHFVGFGGGVVALVVTVYLFVALVKPERF